MSWHAHEAKRGADQIARGIRRCPHCLKEFRPCNIARHRKACLERKKGMPVIDWPGTRADEDASHFEAIEALAAKVKDPAVAEAMKVLMGSTFAMVRQIEALREELSEMQEQSNSLGSG